MLFFKQLNKINGLSHSILEVDLINQEDLHLF